MVRRGGAEPVLNAKKALETAIEMINSYIQQDARYKRPAGLFEPDDVSRDKGLYRELTLVFENKLPPLIDAYIEAEGQEGYDQLKPLHDTYLTLQRKLVDIYRDINQRIDDRVRVVLNYKYSIESLFYALRFYRDRLKEWATLPDEEKQAYESNIQRDTQQYRDDIKKDSDQLEADPGMKKYFKESPLAQSAEKSAIAVARLDAEIPQKLAELRKRDQLAKERKEAEQEVVEDEDRPDRGPSMRAGRKTRRRLRRHRLTRRRLLRR